MDEKADGLKSNNDLFVIFLSDCKIPIYKKPELILGKKVNDIKYSLKLKKEYTLAVRTPTSVQYADPIVIMTDAFPNLIQNKRLDFSYAIQIIKIDEINSIKFIFQCEVNNTFPNTTNQICMPNFIIQFPFDEFYKKEGKDVLDKIVSNFELPIENPQLFINQNIVDFNNIKAKELFKKLRSDTNSNVFKCHLTNKALELMEKRAIKIQQLIDNETIYLERLNYLYNHFIIRIKKAGIFDQREEKYSEFKDCLRKIFKYHTNFLLEIKNINNGYETQISKAFLKLGDGFSINQDLARQYGKLQFIMEEIKRSGKLKNVEVSVFSTEKVDINIITAIPFHPQKYIQKISEICKVTPKSHIDYEFLCMAETKMKMLCSDIEASCDKFKYSCEMINLLNRIDETGEYISLNGQSLKASYEIIIRSRKDFNLKKPGALYIFNDKILLTVKTGFGKTFKEFVLLFNKIKNQSFVISSDMKHDSILFIKDKQSNFNVIFDSKEKKKSFLDIFRNTRQNLLFQKKDQIFAEEVILKNNSDTLPPQVYDISVASLSQTTMIFTGGIAEGKKDHCSPMIVFNSREDEASVDMESIEPFAGMKLAFEKRQSNNGLISLFLFGGKKFHNLMTFSNKQWTELVHSTFTRVKHSFIAHEGKLFVFGGLDDQNQPTNDLWIFSLDKCEWEKIVFKDKVPSPRYDHSAVIYKNVMIIHGGRFNDEKLDDTWFLDLNKMAWSQIKLRKCKNLVPRCGHAAIVVNQFMLVFGGEGYDNLPFALNIENLKVLKLKFVGNYIYGMKNFAAALTSKYKNDNEKQIICFGGLNCDDSIIINSFTKLYLPDEIVNPDQIPSEKNIEV